MSKTYQLPSLLKDVAGAFVVQASAPAQVRHLVDRAIRTALGERRVTAIILPNDLQDMPLEKPPTQARHCAFRCWIFQTEDRALRE